MNAQTTERSPTLPTPWALARPAEQHPESRRSLELEVVVPVHDEERTLALSIRRLHRYLSSSVQLRWRILIADNASTDATPEIAASLAAAMSGVSVLRLEQKGRGRALRAAWSASSARVVAYMDVDLSTDLRALLPLVSPLLTGHSEVAIGTRLAPGSCVSRGVRRELISRVYNHLLRTSLRARFTDAQCGFKAVRADVLPELLAAVEDESWFFDTELLIAAQRRGMRIHEVAVDWVDDPDSRVEIVATVIADLRGVARLIWQTRLARFMAIGVGSTLACAVLFFAPAGWAGSRRANRLDARPTRMLEVTVLVIASLCGAVARCAGMSAWLFTSGRGPQRRRIPSLSTQGH